MLASELIAELTKGISIHGDMPVTLYDDRAEEYSEIETVRIDKNDYVGEDMEKRESIIVILEQ